MPRIRKGEIDMRYTLYIVITRRTYSTPPHPLIARSSSSFTARPLARASHLSPRSPSQPQTLLALYQRRHQLRVLLQQV